MLASDREEVSAGRIRQGPGGGGPWRNSSDGLARDVRDVAAADAEIVELAVRQPAQLAHRLAVAAPVAVVADQVHGFRLSFHLFFVRRKNRRAAVRFEALMLHGSNANCALHHLTRVNNRHPNQKSHCANKLTGFAQAMVGGSGEADRVLQV